jgi:hypothetical protein
MKKFTVKRTNFHGGEKISEHNSIKEAYKKSNAEKISGCTCGCTEIIYNTPEAKNEMKKYEIEKFGYSEIE